MPMAAGPVSSSRSNLWERIVGSLEPRRRCRFDEVYGVYRDLIRDPDVIASGLRDEWERG